MNKGITYKASGRVKSSPCKVSIVAGMVKNLLVKDAMNQLSFCCKKVAKDLFKIASAAVHNAENNYNVVDIMQLKIIEISIGPSLKLKRLDMRARGRANFKYKRYSNVTFVLGMSS